MSKITSKLLSMRGGYSWEDVVAECEAIDCYVDELEQQLSSIALAYKAWMVQDLEIGEEYADKEIADILSGQLDDIHKRVIKRWEDNNET